MERLKYSNGIWVGTTDEGSTSVALLFKIVEETDIGCSVEGRANDGFNNFSIASRNTLSGCDDDLKLGPVELLEW